MSTATDRHHHLVIIGTFEMSFYGRDDRYVKRAVALWLSTQWEKAKQKIHQDHPGSMADSINNGWHDDPICQIGRIRLLPGDIIPCKKYAIIENFPVNETSIKEFVRVFR